MTGGAEEKRAQWLIHSSGHCQSRLLTPEYGLLSLGALRVLPLLPGPRLELDALVSPCGELSWVLGSTRGLVRGAGRALGPCASPLPGVLKGKASWHGGLGVPPGAVLGLILSASAALGCLVGDVWGLGRRPSAGAGWVP